MLAAARTGRLGILNSDTQGAIAVLLTENGASEELLALLSEIERLEDARLRAMFWPLAQWCREVVAFDRSPVQQYQPLVAASGG